MLACYRSVPHGTLWSSYKSPRVILDCLLSDFREDVLSHLSEWKLGPLPSMLMQAGKLSSVQEIPLFTFPCLLPRVQSTQMKQEYYISIKAELKYSCISFSLSRTSGQSESQVQARGLHQGFPLHPPVKLLSALQRLLYRIAISTTNKPGYLQSVLLTSLTAVFSGRKT